MGRDRRSGGGNEISSPSRARGELQSHPSTALLQRSRRLDSSTGDGHDSVGQHYPRPTDRTLPAMDFDSPPSPTPSTSYMPQVKADPDDRPHPKRRGHAPLPEGSITTDKSCLRCRLRKGGS